MASAFRTGEASAEIDHSDTSASLPAVSHRPATAINPLNPSLHLHDLRLVAPLHLPLPAHLLRTCLALDPLFGMAVSNGANRSQHKRAGTRPSTPPAFAPWLCSNGVGQVAHGVFDPASASIAARAGSLKTRCGHVTDGGRTGRSDTRCWEGR